MWSFWIDTGGTFTDCLAQSPEGVLSRRKVLSSSALRGTVGACDRPRKVVLKLPFETEADFFVGYRLRAESSAFESAIVGWNAERCEATLEDDCVGELGEDWVVSLQSPEEPPTLAMRLALGLRLDEPFPEVQLKLATTRGTNALLEGKGARVAFFVTRGFGDVLRIGNQQRPDLFALGIQKPVPLHAKVFEVDERLDAEGTVLEPLRLGPLKGAIEECRAAGIESVAIAFLHSYRNPEHERVLAEHLRANGLSAISCSSALSPFAKIVPRAETAVVDAYLAPIMQRYLDAVERPLGTCSLKVMTSAGGLTSRANYCPKDSLLSGPAGGVVGSSQVAMGAGFPRSVAFDMGGTSTDVSRFDGNLDYKSEQRIGVAHVFAPSLRIETVAAGGGSVCWYDGAALRVGPQSAGAYPGPACYGAGGPLTITDVNLLLGRLDASQFSIPVDVKASQARLQEMRESIGGKTTSDELLMGFLEIANERMAEAIRSISVREGYDPADYVLVAFGGAGGLHACAIASMLGMERVLFPADSGLLSAYGLRRAVVEQVEEKQILALWEECKDVLDTWIDELAGRATKTLQEEGEAVGEMATRSRRLRLRFLGQESGLDVECGEGVDVEASFISLYRERFGFVPQRLPIEVVSLRVSVAVALDRLTSERFVPDEAISSLGGRGETIERGALKPRAQVIGPAVVQDGFSTVYVAQGWRAVVGSALSLRLEASSSELYESSSVISDVAALELFTNRFLSIVDEMGALLERSAFSTNVKERKDFSCALLDRDGFLVANAPHIPVHLGALGVCLRTVLRAFSLGPGDVLATNHPRYGGSHLPDVTLLAGVYTKSGDLIGYVANRAHHAEIGGICPGSMPPNACSLEEEGVTLDGVYLSRAGRVDWAEVRTALTEARYPTRKLDENMADLAAQLASIRKGVAGALELAEASGEARVQDFMQRLKRRAGVALDTALASRSLVAVTAEETLDNGARICVTVEPRNGRLAVDFAGSSPVRADNYNATPAIVSSALVYVLRLMVDQDIPLNEGLMEWVDLRIPEGSFLNPGFSDVPSDCPPVVAGNVEVSQRIVDTLIKAFGLAGGSQGTMNNLIFGNERCSYYETIAGGEGATANRVGASGVHTHMTNTAMTDAEIFELRFPVRLEAFRLRADSGGEGLNRGGDGIERRIRFLEDVELSLLTQHRKSGPFGVFGGEAGQQGEQWLLTPDGKRLALDSDASVRVEAGSVLEIRTPGGGGWGG